MKEKNLKILISLMSIALAGLISIQIYWIANAIRLEEEKFNKNVSSALMAAVDELEDREAKRLVISNVFSLNDESIVLLDSLTEDNDIKVWQDDNSFTWQHKSSGETNSFVEVQSSKDKEGAKVVVKVESTKEDSTGKKVKRDFIIERRVDSLQQRKTEVVQNVVDQLVWLSNKKNINDRISKNEIEKLLKEKLNEFGVNAEYRFAVKSGLKDSLFFLNENKNKEYYLNTQYRAKLFPDDAFDNLNYLLLVFPGRTEYFINSIMLALIVSFLVILAVIILYYKTVRMLIQQKKISEMKNDLINNISHEFKTPLATISLATEALNEPGLIIQESSMNKYTGMISEETGKLKKMVDTLLNTALFKNGSFQLDKEETDVHKLIFSVAENYKLNIQNRNGNLFLNLNAERNIINADKMHLTNIISNLIDNAVKYTGEKPEIIIETKNNSTGIEISVKDNGVGIHGDHHKHIFENFYRVPKGDLHDTKGFGIGLSYVKKLVESHSGKIYLQSKQGKGTTFTIQLPYE